MARTPSESDLWTVREAIRMLDVAKQDVERANRGTDETLKARAARDLKNAIDAVIAAGHRLT